MLLAVMMACLIPLGQACHSSFRQQQQEKALKELREMIEPEPLEISSEPAEPGDGGQQEADTFAGNLPAEAEESPPPLLEKYAALHEENPDLAGWLSIEGMVIDYPVMQCEDDEYYLHHDFYGNDSKYGCLYVRGVADVNTPGTNFIIYGHNMKDGSMFGDLDLYRKESFFGSIQPFPLTRSTRRGLMRSWQCSDPRSTARRRTYSSIISFMRREPRRSLPVSMKISRNCPCMIRG